MNLKTELAKTIKRANDLVEGAKAASRQLTAEETTELDTLVSQAEGLKAQIAEAEKGDALMERLSGMAPELKTGDGSGSDRPARSIGDHFVKSMGKRTLKTPGTIEAPEYGVKAATDTVVTGGADSSMAAVLTDVDRTIVTGYRRPTVTDVMGVGSISGQAITYYVEQALEGDFGMVSEAGAKPQMSYVLPEPVTDRLKEIAGWIRLSDDMVDDLPFIVSEINGRLMYNLSLKEESQLLNGNGSGNNILGVLNRSGIQTEAATAVEDNPDALFRAATKVQSVTGLAADAVLIHPVDYQVMRLSRDSNEQYYGGGFFQGQYGQNGIQWQPPVWGLNTVVTPAVEQGTAVVGAFRNATTVYRKGGVRVESTNSHEDDFTNDRITIRAKTRLALAVRRPAAIVKVTMGSEG